MGTKDTQDNDLSHNPPDSGWETYEFGHVPPESDLNLEAASKELEELMAEVDQASSCPPSGPSNSHKPKETQEPAHPSKVQKGSQVPPAPTNPPDAASNRASRWPILLSLVVLAMLVLVYQYSQKETNPPVNMLASGPQLGSVSPANQEAMPSLNGAKRTTSAEVHSPPETETASSAQGVAEAPLPKETQTDSTRPEAAEAPLTEKAQTESTKPETAEASLPKGSGSTLVPQNPSANYALQIGAFLFRSTLENAERKVRQLGLVSERFEVVRPIEVYRVSIGRFEDEEAAKHALTKIHAITKSAFLLRRGHAWNVYAASFFNRRRAEQLKNTLSQQGVNAYLEKAAVNRTTFLLQCGTFATMEEARKMQKEARAIGLEARIVKTDHGA